MTYLKRSNRPRRGSGATILAIVGIIGVFSINYLFPKALPSVLYPVTSTFWNGESSSVGFFVYMAKIVQSKYALVKENKRLTDEIALRDRSILSLDMLKTENESLKNSLGRTGKGNYALGVILSRPPASLYDTLIIDIGASDGVKPGNKVYAEGDILLGDVTDVFAGQSKVSLFSTPGRTMQVLVGTTTIAADAMGKGGGNFIMKLPAGLKVSKGAIVTLPQVRLHTFGIVESISVDSTASIQTILFKSPVNLSQLATVEVDRSSLMATTTVKK